MNLNTQIFSVGKTDRRNDDMVFAVPLFRHQVLGVLGDFTSDSPQGVNEACRGHLEAFIADKLATWREMLLPPERLLPLLLRKANDWLADFGQKAQTTLIVFCWDLRAEACHFISVGDSGLAVVGAAGVRYLREGDRDGLRISAGFLPGPVDATVRVAPVRRDETLFAFSDGLWENTTTFMSDALLQEVFGPSDLDDIARRLQTRILEPAIRKDDLSILVMKGETMDRQGSTLDNEQLERLIGQVVERQVDALVGSARAGEPTPIERDLLRWLEDAPRIQRQLADVLGEQLGRSIEGQVKKLLEEQREMFQRQLGEQQRRLESQLRDQSDQIKRLEQELAKGGSSRKSEPRPPSPSAEQQTAARSAPQSARSPKGESAAPKPKPDVFETKIKSDSADDLLQKPWLNFAIVLAAVICVGVFIKIAFYPSKPKPQVDATQTGQPVDGQTPTVQVEPEPEPPTVTYSPAPIPAGLLVAMNLDHYTYAAQTGAIAKALAGLDAAPTGPLPLADSPGLSEVALAKNFNWQQNKKAPAAMVSKLWLQAHAGAVVDGAPGNGTRTKFEAKFAPKLEAAQRLVKALEQPVVSELDKQILETYQLTQGVYMGELQELAKKLIAKGGDKPKLKVAWYRGQRYLTTTVKLENSKARAWLDLVKAKPYLDTGDLGLELRAIWLAAQVDLDETDGAAGETLKRAIAPTKTCAELLTEGLNQWK